MITSEELKRRLWNGADQLRGSMDASRYKDYMLGLMFYKFLSDKTLQAFQSFAQISATGVDLVKVYSESVKACQKDNMSFADNRLIKAIKTNQGFYVLPKHLYQSWINDINNGEFELEKVTEALNTFERNIDAQKDSDDFKGLFSNLDLTDTALGSSLKQRSDNIKKLILLFADLDMVELQENDILGDAYEYLIGMFAMESGKKAGEFYTPHFVSEVIAQIIAKSTKISSIYDPAVGSGSLLLTVKNHLSVDDREVLHYYGQEKNTATYNLTRMNLLLHGIKPEKIDIRNGDTLAEDWPEDPHRPGEGILFDAVAMNPPYSLKNWNSSGLKSTDPRFEFVDGVLPPDNKGDYAFLLHGLYHLNRAGGIMGIVLPHGVLFRGAAEGEIRKSLIDKDCIDAVIGLPSGMFTNTGIPVIIMILRKDRKFDEPVLIIDASNGYSKQGKQNVLRERDIARIVDTYIERKEEKGFSHLASKKEIVANDYNLNIPRYVVNISETISDDVDAHLYGGIPETNIKRLEVLNATVPEVLKEEFSDLRPGYLKMKCTPDEFEKEVVNTNSVIDKLSRIKKETNDYIDRYWNKIRSIAADTKEINLKEEMLLEIKKELNEFAHVDIYEGYQIIADIWKTSLSHDIDVIATNGFYTSGRMRVPNMIMKGSGDEKHEEQDGFIGAIVPNELIRKRLFVNEVNEINSISERIAELDSKISELTENAMDESNEDYSCLGDCLKESGDAIERKKVKAAIKTAEKGSSVRKILEACEKLFSEKADKAKLIRQKENELEIAVQDRILTLTDEEIDMLMYEKWFGAIEKEVESLVLSPLKNEIDIVRELNDRYSDTLEDMDTQISFLTHQIENFQKELVLINE